MITDSEIADTWKRLAKTNIPPHKLEALRELFHAAKVRGSDPFVTVLIAHECRADAHAAEIRDAYASGKSGLTKDIEAMRAQIVTGIANKAGATIENAISRETKAMLIRWVLVAIVLVTITFVAVADFSYKAGEKSGFNNGVNITQVVESWAKTEEARTFYSHKRTIDSLLNCRRDRETSWAVKDGYCYPFAEFNNDGQRMVSGWPIPK